MAEEIPEVECSVCGRDGGPLKGCSICGGNQRYTKNRAFTLSDFKAGRVAEQKRYGPDGDVGPKTNDPLWVGTEHH